jgi:hypothetical protein
MPGKIVGPCPTCDLGDRWTNNDDNETPPALCDDCVAALQDAADGR